MASIATGQDPGGFDSSLVVILSTLFFFFFTPVLVSVRRDRLDRTGPHGSVSDHKLFPNASFHGPVNVKGFQKLMVELPSLDKKDIIYMYSSLQTSSAQYNMLLRRWEDVEKD